MWDHLLLRTPKEIAATVWNAVFTLMQPQQPQRKAPAGPESPTSAATAPHPTGTVSSSAHHPGSMEAQQAATAAALSGPDEVCEEDCFSIAVCIVLLSQRATGKVDWPGAVLIHFNTSSRLGARVNPEGSQPHTLALLQLCASLSFRC